jgi:hypothetical protein
MRSRLAIPALAVAALVGPAAWAVTEFDNPNAAPSGAHYRQGYSEPLCTLQNGRMTCTATQIAGIGNLDGDVVLSVSTAGNVECSNGGGQVVEVKAQSTSTITGDALTRNRNGTLYVSEISAAVATESQLLASAECPKSDTKNKNWDKALSGTPTVTYTYTLKLEGFSDYVIHQPPR